MIDMTRPLHIVHAEQLLTAMRSSGLTPQQAAEALHTALFMMHKGNGIHIADMVVMARQEFAVLEAGTIFSEPLKGLTQ